MTCADRSPQAAYRCGDSTGRARCRASCFPFNCTCERTCGHQTRAYDSTALPGAGRRGLPLPAVALSCLQAGRFLDVGVDGAYTPTHSGARVHALCTQLNGKQGACPARIGPTCAAPATVSEGIVKTMQSWLQCVHVMT